MPMPPILIQGDETTGKMMGVLLASELYRYDEAAQAFDGALQDNPEDGSGVEPKS